MTVAPAAPPAAADRVKQLLVAGKTTMQVADLTGWPRPRVVALVNSIHGWLLDPQKDTVYQPDNPGMVAQLPRHQDSIADLLMDAAQIDDPAVQREHRKAREAIAKLRATVETVTQRVEAERARQKEIDDARAAVEAAEKQLAEARARAKEVGLKRRPKTTAETGGPTPKELRAWAAEHGIDCPKHGRVPKVVTDAYEAAQ